MTIGLDRAKRGTTPTWLLEHLDVAAPTWPRCRANPVEPAVGRGRQARGRRRQRSLDAVERQAARRGPGSDPLARDDQRCTAPSRAATEARSGPEPVVQRMQPRRFRRARRRRRSSRRRAARDRERGHKRTTRERSSTRPWRAACAPASARVPDGRESAAPRGPRSGVVSSEWTPLPAHVTSA
jgi:hypothetical protein